jgi:hypothetical protein
MKHPAVNPFTLIPLFLLIFCAALLRAHPGIGIVFDERSGNIFYTDLKNVYKIAPDGRETVAAPHVHTHELALDAEGNLYGAHLWYTGERDNRWRQYIWKYANKGTLSTHVPEGDALTMGFSLVRDEQFNAYSWRVEGGEVLFEKQTPDGRKSLLGKRAFKAVGWLKAEKGGDLYFNDEDDLWRLSQDGTFKLIAKDLYSAKNPFSVFKDKNSVFGVWLDSARNVYVAVHSGACVKKIDANGRITVVYESPLTWSPVGGVFDNKGCLWMLESTFTGKMRARKVEQTCKSATPNGFPGGTRGGAGMVLLLAAVGLYWALSFGKYRQRKGILKAIAGN